MVACYRFTIFLFEFLERSKVYLRPLEHFFCSSSPNGVDKDARFGMKLLNWLIQPNSDLISLIHRGSFKFLYALDLLSK